MMVGQKYRPEIANERFDAIVIGSGPGGLSTAVFLAKHKKKVLVLERHYTAGGFTHTFQRNHFEWDVGFHYMGDVHRENSLLYKLFHYLSDGELKWAPMPDVYDRMVFPDKSYDFVRDKGPFEENLASYFPEDKKAISEYLAILKKVRKTAKPFFMERLFSPFWGKLLYPFWTKNFRSYSEKTTLEVLKTLTKNQKLIAVLTGQYGDYGLPPGQSSFAMHALVAGHYLGGGSYCVGGASRIAETMTKVIEKAGGKVIISADVKEVIVKNGRAVGVRLSDKNELFASIIVSNAGARNTFLHLLPESESLQPIRSAMKEIPPSVAHVCLYVGLRGNAKTLNVPKTNLWIYPGYDHDQSCARYAADPATDFPVVYISFPSAKDPDWEKKHPDQSTIEVIAPLPYDLFVPWKDSRWRHRGEEYESLKQNLTTRLLEELYRQVPGTKGNVEYSELSTPLSTQHFANYETGEIYGLEHSPARFRQRWLRVHTPIKKLYLTGQDLFTCGVSSAAFSGVLTASTILKKNLLKQI